MILTGRETSVPRERAARRTELFGLIRRHGDRLAGRRHILACSSDRIAGGKAEGRDNSECDQSLTCHAILLGSLRGTFELRARGLGIVIVRSSSAPVSKKPDTVPKDGPTNFGCEAAHDDRYADPGCGTEQATLPRLPRQTSAKHGSSEFADHNISFKVRAPPPAMMPSPLIHPRIVN